MRSSRIGGVSDGSSEAPLTDAAAKLRREAERHDRAARAGSLREAQGQRERRRWAPSAGEALILAAALLVAVVMVYPTAWVFFASFKTQETLFSGEFAAYTLRNYARLLGSGFGVHVVNSLGICLMAVTVSTAPTFTAGHPRALWEGRYSHGMSTSCGPPGATSSNYDVTADGQRFLMIKDDAPYTAVSKQLIVVLSWADELSRLSKI